MKKSRKIAAIALQLALDSLSKSRDPDALEAVEILTQFKQSLQEDSDRSDALARLDDARKRRAEKIQANGKKLMGA